MQADRHDTEIGQRIGKLTERQKECLDLAAEGLSTKEIARNLGVSPSTVDNHILAALTKLEVRSRREAIRLLRPARRQNGGEQTTQRPVVPTQGFLPPFGGKLNQASSRHRLTQIFGIGIVSVLAVMAVLLTISGALHLLEYWSGGQSG